MTDQPIPELTAGEAMLFAGLLTAHGGSIGPDTVNSASTIFARLREHTGQRWPGVKPEAEELLRSLLRWQPPEDVDLMRAYFETGGATEPVGDSQRAPTSEELAAHLRTLGRRYDLQRATVRSYQERNDATSRAITELAERLGLAPKGRLVSDADLIAEISRAVDARAPGIG